MFKNIYDLGANRGKNIQYFLDNAEKVIAVEPIPELVSEIKVKFSKEIKKNKLVVVNKAVVAKEGMEKTSFYINNEKNWESTLLSNSLYKKIEVAAITPSDLFDKFGSPDCLKIDVENYDIEILKYINSMNIIPNYLIFEAQTKKALDFVLNNFEYKHYNFVIGHRVGQDYGSINLETHSSGPIKKDLKYKWVGKKTINNYLKISNFGWIDIHCSNNSFNTPSSKGIISTVFYLFRDRVFTLVLPFRNKVIGKLKLKLN